MSFLPPLVEFRDAKAFEGGMCTMGALQGKLQNLTLYPRGLAHSVIMPLSASSKHVFLAVGIALIVVGLMVVARFVTYFVQHVARKRNMRTVTDSSEVLRGVNLGSLASALQRCSLVLASFQTVLPDLMGTVTDVTTLLATRWAEGASDNGVGVSSSGGGNSSPWPPLLLGSVMTTSLVASCTVLHVVDLDRCRVGARSGALARADGVLHVSRSV